MDPQFHHSAQGADLRLLCIELQRIRDWREVAHHWRIEPADNAHVSQQNGTSSSWLSALGRRRFGRVRQISLFCNWGEVLDISASGMRLKCRRRPPLNRTVEIRLKGFALPEPLMVKCQWAKRAGWFRHEVGVVFIDPSKELVQRLMMISGCGSMLSKSHAPLASAPACSTTSKAA